MGKKAGKGKGKGKETEKQASKKAEKAHKKEVAAAGEDDIDAIIAAVMEAERAQKTSTEKHLDAPPSARSNASLVAHPLKDELILFGGERFNGDKCSLYNELFFYNIKTAKWRQTIIPQGPAPRSSHQAVAMERAGGQMWVFGGEFVSPSQTQFHHYKELWCLHLGDTNLRWEKVETKGGPSARSGHRMIHCKGKIIVFGGFFDNSRKVKYHNDLWVFDLDSQSWSNPDPGSSDPLVSPSPRSAFSFAAHTETAILYGGYSKETATAKGQQDQGTIYNDLWQLDCSSWRWRKLKKTGMYPSKLLAGLSCVVGTKSRAFFFGGVTDQESPDGTDLVSEFYNDLYILNLDQNKWYPGHLNVQAAEAAAAAATAAAVAAGDEVPKEKKTFVMATGDQKEYQMPEELDEVKYFRPSPRTSALMVVKGNTLFLYGGSVEKGKREITFSDLYSLNLAKLDGWTTLIEMDPESQEWLGGESSDEGEENDEEGEEGEEEEADDDDDDASSEEDAEGNLKPLTKKLAQARMHHFPTRV